MIQINLLPWREQARKIKQIEFGLLLLASFLAALFLVLLTHLFFNSLLNHQLKRNAYLETILSEEQAKLSVLKNKQKEQDKTLLDLNFIFRLRQNNFAIIRMLDELARIIPESIELEQLKRQGSNVSIAGLAKSGLEITLLMEKISNSGVFLQPTLGEISDKDKESTDERTFQLTVELQEYQHG